MLTFDNKKRMNTVDKEVDRLVKFLWNNKLTEEEYKVELRKLLYGVVTRVGESVAEKYRITMHISKKIRKEKAIKRAEEALETGENIISEHKAKKK